MTDFQKFVMIPVDRYKNLLEGKNRVDNSVEVGGNKNINTRTSDTPEETKHSTKEEEKRTLPPTQNDLPTPPPPGIPYKPTHWISLHD